MRVNAEVESHRRHTEQSIKPQVPMTKLEAREDPRLVPLGALQRAAGLDDLPQVLNVIRGGMSLVGPRPCLRYECEQYAAWHWERFDSAPRLTRLWQVSAKNRTTFNDMVRLDIISHFPPSAAPPGGNCQFDVAIRLMIMSNYLWAADIAEFTQRPTFS